VGADSRQLAFIERETRGVTKRLIPDYLTPEATMHAVVRAFPGEPSESRWLRVVAVGDRRVRPMNIGANPVDEIFAYEWAPDGHALRQPPALLPVGSRRGRPHLPAGDARRGATDEARRQLGV
jgi:hypothetical protein